jgi:glycosyltransferase involved in cell wall biosynthesis
MRIPTVSICVPTYNGERYLRPCLDSVLVQTHGDFELLIVDDASTDGTPELLDAYAARDSRVRLVRNASNRGLVGNWNRCIELARARWIKFAFQDDLLAPDCVERMLAAGAARPIVFARREFIFEQGTPDDVCAFYRKLPCISGVLGGDADVTADEVCAGVLREPLNFFGEPTAALLHRSLFERFGLFNADLEQLCDLEFWIRAASNTGLAWIDAPLAAFRYHTKSTSAGNRDPSRDELVSVYDRLLIQHQAAYSDAYANLRDVSCRQQPPGDLAREFSEKAAWVCRRAHHGPDPRWRERWDALSRRYPELAATAAQTTRPTARAWWARSISWRLNRRTGELER